MTGKLKIEGNMGKAMKLEKLMGQMQKRGYHTVARAISTPCLSSTRAFSSAPSEYTEVTEVLDRIRGVTSPKVAKKVDAIFV